ncbi:hypothetical protein EJ08DRAFT_698933 [Tothia fuscella]|uniref:Uncharacterized protein n=1 Tax=Tothia fuscella TaxID=1048955 RepID=A0A9P4TVZ0_9PEZI|nr:hypothetical protein EJ08DRAFT_698933 [Tothia fuscella]
MSNHTTNNKKRKSEEDIDTTVVSAGIKRLRLNEHPPPLSLPIPFHIKPKTTTASQFLQDVEMTTGQVEFALTSPFRYSFETDPALSVQANTAASNCDLMDVSPDARSNANEKPQVNRQEQIEAGPNEMSHAEEVLTNRVLDIYMAMSQHKDLAKPTVRAISKGLFHFQPDILQALDGTKVVAFVKDVLVKIDMDYDGIRLDGLDLRVLHKYFYGSEFQGGFCSFCSCAPAV